MTILHPPSVEQQSIIDNLRTKNVNVQAVAGSGKTTSILHIARQFPDIRILVLTYNARLKLETREKAKSLGLHNMEIHSYHAFCVKYYDKLCYTDNKIISVLGKDERAKNPISFDYELVIVDEIQDMTMLYYKLVLDILNRHKIKPKLCVLGDKHQNIFKFNNADARFLTKSNMLLNYNTNEWAFCTLSVSYRLTNQMSGFINNCVFGHEKIKTCKNGPDVEYKICDLFRAKSHIYYSLKDILKSYSYGDIFILAPSLKSSSAPPRLLANSLSDDGIPIFVSSNDEEKIDEDIIKGKIVFSTYHQTKGLERPVVFVYNFSAGYYTYFNKNADSTKCCNELYVAITRASEKLILLHHYTEEYFSFVNQDLLNTYCNVTVHVRAKLKKVEENGAITPYSVTELLNHLPSTVIAHAKNFLTITKVHNKKKSIKIPIKTKQGKYFENVSEITGTAIPSYFEYINKNNMEIHKKLLMDNVINNDDKNNFVIGSKEINVSNIDDLDNEKLLILSNMYCSHMSGYKFKLNQISNYNWLSKNDLDLCIERLAQHVDKNATHEVLFEYTNELLLSKKKILVGAVDCIDKKNKNVWEFKCVNKLGDIHFLQIAIYSFMLQNEYVNQLNIDLENSLECGNVDIDGLYKKYSTDFEYKLFNILDNEIYTVECVTDKLLEMLNYLINNKFDVEYEVPQIKFDKQVNDVRNDIFGVVVL